MDSNQDIADALLLYGKKTMGNPNLLEEIFHDFHYKVLSNLLKFMNSPSLFKHKYIASLLDHEEINGAKNTPATRKKHYHQRD